MSKTVISQVPRIAKGSSLPLKTFPFSIFMPGRAGGSRQDGGGSPVCSTPHLEGGSLSPRYAIFLCSLGDLSMADYQKKCQKLTHYMR